MPFLLGHYILYSMLNREAVPPVLCVITETNKSFFFFSLVF